MGRYSGTVRGLIPVGGARFSVPVQMGPGTHLQPPITKDTGSFPGVKRPGRDFDHPPPSRAEVKKVVVLYLYFSGLSRVNLTFYLYLYGCQKRQLLYP